jgi:hypothetical protein
MAPRSLARAEIKHCLSPDFPDFKAIYSVRPGHLVKLNPDRRIERLGEDHVDYLLGRDYCASHRVIGDDHGHTAQNDRATPLWR